MADTSKLQVTSDLMATRSQTPLVKGERATSVARGFLIKQTDIKTGLVLEGGSMRGMFTCGVTDVMAENGIEFDGTVGVSAGAAFGCNIKSRQPGRAIRYNKRYCTDWRFASWRSFILTGDLYGAKFCYETIPNKLDLFDTKAFAENPTDFYVVATDVVTGKAVYHKCTDANKTDIRWIRASASLPVASRIVKIDGGKYLDGGMADSIPIKYFESIGYNRNVVILTQPKGFVKEINPLLPLVKVRMHKYPNLIEAVATRHIRYNEATNYVFDKASKGELFVIAPPEPLNIQGVIHDPTELERVYQIGRKTMEQQLDSLKEYLK